MMYYSMKTRQAVVSIMQDLRDKDKTEGHLQAMLV